MQNSPKIRTQTFLCFILLTLITFFSCSKDDEELNNLSLVKATASTGLQAYAKASKIEGSAPLKVSFSGNSSKNKTKIAKWNWTFGDGNRSGNKNPVHTFTKPGSYKVALSVRDNKGITASKALTIVVGGGTSGLKAYAKASKIEGSAPLKVSFSGSSSKNKTKIAKWNWTFGDGNRSGNKNPEHIFTKPGTYEVILSLDDESGASATNMLTIVVGGNGSSPKTKSSGNYPSNAVFASSFGYNSSDATDALEAALRSGNSFVVVDKQRSDWIIRPLNLFDLKDITIVFEPGVVLRAKSGAFRKSNDQLLQLFRARNVTIEGYGATFKMNKNEYNSDEHRHGLAINKCNNVTVRGLTIKDSGGDGIMIAGMEKGSYSQNITIEDIVSTNNRRLGLGIISAQNVWVKNSEFSHTNGTKPEAGVDLEPNNSSDRLVNINFTNCKFSNNDSMGFYLSTGKLNGSSTPVSVKVSNSEFSYNAKSPEGRTPKTGILLSQGATSNPVRGEIVFEKVLFNGSNHRIIFSKNSAESYRAIFKDCVARNVGRSGKSPLIELEALSTVNTVGGFVFDNFSLEYTSDVPFMQIRASRNYTVKDVNGDFRIKEPNDNPLNYVGGYNTAKNKNVSIDYRHIN